ncbi:MAG: TonB-dependent receptor plug domain-containing protein [Rhodothermaceae bacterium]|nr:TonB-dependent receptor plug domain-containing protein [Rhodothermaceae bacterium]MYG69046.1 TonB-dependent receptor plug domain-containing protein [Rhodothermaceae bacterium]MYJ43775.1 TonB-dependent receptor plug domain-containing protein [Rhodothermaceae bacterium]
MKSQRLLLLILLSVWANATLGQTASIRGFVTDADDLEALAGVSVVLESDTGGLRGGVTDSDGIYNLTRIAPGTYVLRFSFVGYIAWSDTLEFRAGQRLNLNVALQSTPGVLEEMIVEAEIETGAAQVTAGLQTISPRDMDLLPTPDVSGDLASFLTTLPGVVTLGDRGGQYYIRGGEPSHNMTLIDGMQVYQPYHILGFYSAFPSDIIHRADIHTAGYGAPFTGRISSVIDIKSRNGDKRNYGGAASIAPFVSSAQIEGPLIYNKLSFLASARQSVVKQIAQHYVAQDMPYTFGDAFLKVHGQVGSNSQLSISGIYTNDRGTIGLEAEDRILEEVGWRNAAVGVRYVVLPRALPFVAEIQLSYSFLKTNQGPTKDPVRWSRISGFQYAVHMNSFYERTQWKWGLYWRAPQVTAHLGGLFQDLDVGMSRRHKTGIYLEPDFYITSKLRARVTAIAELFPGQLAGRSNLEARFRAIWQHREHEVSLGAGWYHQEIFGLSDRRDATNIFTSWRSAPVEDLSRSIHALAGYRTSPYPWLELSLETYYKQLQDLFIAEWTAFPRFTSLLQRADGRAMGVELRAEIRRQKVYGYINYGLSSVRYTSKQPTGELWFGSADLDFRPPHDRRHQLNVVATTRISDYDLSARWNFGSGRPFNHVYGFDGFLLLDRVKDLFTAPDNQRVIYGRPFRGLLPTYHRLDLSIERDFTFDAFMLTAQVGVINAYNRRNLFALDLFTAARNYQLPIVPIAGLKIDLD